MVWPSLLFQTLAWPTRVLTCSEGDRPHPFCRILRPCPLSGPNSTSCLSIFPQIHDRMDLLPRQPLRLGSRDPGQTRVADTSVWGALRAANQLQTYPRDQLHRPLEVLRFGQGGWAFLTGPGLGRPHEVMYRPQLDPQEALRLTIESAIVLVLGAPSGTAFGIDQHAFAVGDRFRGVKMIPPGPHFVSARAGSPDGGGLATMSGEFVWLAPRQVLVRRWDPEAEQLAAMDDEDEEERYAAGARSMDFDRGLAPYDLEGHAHWRALTGFITQATLSRVSPVGRLIGTDDRMGGADEGPQTAAERRLEEHLEAGRRLRGDPEGSEGGPAADGGLDVTIVNPERSTGHSGSGPAGDAEMADAEPGPSEATAAGPLERRDEASAGGAAAMRGGRCSYVTIPRLVKERGADPKRLTAINMDRSGLLEGLVAGPLQGCGEELLGEMQHAFVALVMGQSLQGLRHWRAVVDLLLHADAAMLGPHSSLVAAGLRALAAQLAFMGGATGADALLGEGFLEDVIQGSFLREGLAGLFEVLAEEGAAAPLLLRQAADELRQAVKRHLGWDVSVEELGGGEDGPVFVDPAELGYA